MSRRSLPTLVRSSEALGLPTIMDRALAARYGTPYIKATAFAIDMDCVQRWSEHRNERFDETAWPFGWEVFLLERALVLLMDSTQHEMLDVVGHAVHERVEHIGDVLGSQWLFALYDLSHRGVWPEGLRRILSQWVHPAELIAALDTFWADSEMHELDLSKRCLNVSEVKMAPTTYAQLNAWVSELSQVQVRA